ncbi:hypothetical protein [Leptospira perolatii]|nr:hypothetical protein [Leptospira perolatii]
MNLRKGSLFKTKKFQAIIAVLLVFASAASAAYSLKEIPDSIGPDGRNISRQFLQFLKIVAMKNQYDGKAIQFHKYLDRSLERFELKNLYNSEYMHREGSSHFVTYRGRYSSEGYKVSLENVRFHDVPIPQFGDFSAEFALKHNANPKFGGNSYSGNLDLLTHMGPFTHKHGLNVMDSGLRFLNAENVKNISAPNTSIFKKVKDAESRKVLNDFAHSFPALAKYLNYYFGLDSLVKVKAEGKGEGITEFVFDGNVEQTLMVDYPELGDYLDDIKYLGWVKARIMNSQGRIVSEFYIETKKSEIKFRFFTKDGKIIPFDLKGNFYPGESFHLNGLSEYPFAVNVSLEANVYGLVLDNEFIQLQGKFSNTSNSGVLNLKVAKIDKFDVSGAFAYLAPSWAINLFIPGNLESIIHEFTETVVNANDGKGTVVVLRWDRDSSKTIMKTHVETEFLDNFFIRFGLKIWNHRVLPNEDARDDIRKVFTKTMDLLLLSI